MKAGLEKGGDVTNTCQHLKKGVMSEGGRSDGEFDASAPQSLRAHSEISPLRHPRVQKTSPKIGDF